MLKFQQPSLPEPTDILQIINNINRRYTIGRQQYILLIKRQKQKNYCTLYITDCQSKFWIKKVDQLFLEQLKTNMSINTEINIFAKHFSINLKENSLIVLEDDSVKVSLELRIGQGIAMNCSFQVQSSIDSNQSAQDFKMILRNFLKQLYEAKESQVQQERKKWEKLVEEEKRRKQIAQRSDSVYVKQVLNGMKRNADDLKPKNRSLMNPNQKKRRAPGIKFQGQL